jgi:hypothetical protein
MKGCQYSECREAAEEIEKMLEKLKEIGDKFSKDMLKL